MAAKTANILARVEPEVKEQTEAIMAQLGIPINMLSKQIILTKSIPFSPALPTAPMAQDEMSPAVFDAMMERGLTEAKAGRSRPATKVFSELRQEIGE